MLSVYRTTVSICCGKRRATSFTRVLEGDKPVPISRVFGPLFFSGQSVVVDVKRVGFRPRAVVEGRGVVAVFAREFISMNMFTGSNPQVGYMQKNKMNILRGRIARLYAI